MTHAHLSPGMQRLIREFPCDGQGCVGVRGVPCPYQESSEECPYRVHIRSSMVWMRDSGAFTRQGAPRLYQQLFELYAWLRVEYGIIKAQIPALLAKRAEAYSFGGNVWTASRVAEVIYSTF